MNHTRRGLEADVRLSLQLPATTDPLLYEHHHGRQATTTDCDILPSTLAHGDQF